MTQSSPGGAVRLGAYPDFMTVWRGQTISVFGSQMAAFAISIWIYRETGSVLQFGAVIAAQLVPSILFAPLTGLLVDRYHRKYVMLATEVGLTVAALALWALLRAGWLTPTNMLLFSPVIALFGSIHQIAYASSIGLLVPRAAYARANGYVQMGINGSAAIVPLISVHALEELGLGMVILLNAATYVMAAVSLAFARFMPKPEVAAKPRKPFSLAGLLEQLSFGLRYIRAQRGLMVLVLFLCAVSVLNGVVLVLFRPMILGSASDAVLGWLATIAGFGGLAGAIAASTFSARADRVRTLLCASMISGTSMALCGLCTNFPTLAVLAFLFSFSAPFILVSGQTLMQMITPTEIQGRVFSTRAFFSGLALIAAVSIAPVLAEYGFAPWMASGHVLAPFAHWLDAGASAPMRAVFTLTGAGMVVLALAAVRSAPFRALRAQMSEAHLVAARA
ncbi:MFS transporter [Pseudoduganella flava]|nr:MFS transporter [Pseudoduganella flava]TWI46488.1 MFS transporter [Pseudoduganella flava]